MVDVSQLDSGGLLTPAELAERVKVSIQAVTDWRYRGQGPAYVKLGNRPKSPIRYRLSDVIAWEGKLRRIVPSVEENAEAEYDALQAG